MFTGIVEELGEITSVVPLDDDALLLAVAGPRVVSDARPGDSIAVNGVCLTVRDLSDGGFTADVMRETLLRSSLRDVEPGTPVNLERPVTPSGRMGGHIVQGHVDGVGHILERRPAKTWEIVRIGLPEVLARYVVEKGSIAVDGVSLTVSAVGPAPGTDAGAGPWFEVSLIPTTLEGTTLGRCAIGAPVNIEVDVIAKYVESLVRGEGS